MTDPATPDGTHDASLDLPTRRATKRLARSIAHAVAPGDCVVLDGPLGAGKTFLVRAVCRAVGLPEREPVTSPTFTLVNQYDTTPPLTHADLYRLDDDGDVERLGLAAARGDGRVLFVEWGAPYVAVLGGDALLVRLTREPRRATLEATGRRSRALSRHILGDAGSG